MGTEYSIRLNVGFLVRFDAIVEKFGKTIPEKGSWQDRYHPFTGKKLPQQYIVEHYEHDVLVYDGESYDIEDSWSVKEFLEILSDKIGSNCFCEYLNPDSDDAEVAFGVLLKHEGPTIDYGLVTIENSYVHLSDINEKGDDLDNIKSFLNKLGLEYDGPCVYASLKVF